MRVDVTIPAKPHRVSKDCYTSCSQASRGRRRTVNVGKENTGKTVELEIIHGVITVIDPATGEILAEQTLDTTRDYQYRKPMPGVNHALRDDVNHTPRHPSIMPRDNATLFKWHLHQMRTC